MVLLQKLPDPEAAQGDFILHIRMGEEHALKSQLGAVREVVL